MSSRYHVSKSAASIAVVLVTITVIATVAGCAIAGDLMQPKEPPLAGSAAPSFEGSASGFTDMIAGAPDVGGADGVVMAAELAERKLVFTGELAIEVKDPRASMDEIARWVQAHGGFVEQSSVSDGPSGTSVSMVIRSPSATFDETREHLRKQAESVLRDDKRRADVTGQYADMDARLTNLKAAESELRELLSQAREKGGTTEDVLRIYNEVTRIRGEVDSLQAQFDALSEQVALSTLKVELVSVAGVPTLGGGRWRPGVTLRKAYSDLVGGMQNLGDIAIYLVVAVLPQLLIVCLVLWALYRLLRRVRPRRPKPSREAPSSALDTPPSA